MIKEWISIVQIRNNGKAWDTLYSKENYKILKSQNGVVQHRL